jgi:streptogramin lyase
VAEQPEGEDQLAGLAERVAQQEAKRRPWPRRMRVAISLAALAIAGGIGLGVYSAVSKTPAESGVLYFSTFTQNALYKVDFSFKGSKPIFGLQTKVARLHGSDGVVFEADGRILVGGQGTGNIEEFDPKTGQVRTEATGCPGAFLLVIDPTGSTVYTAGLPGPLCSAPTNPLGPGTKHTLRGDDTEVNTFAFTPQGQVFYTSSPPSGVGNFGRIDLQTFTTTRELSSIPAGHTVIYDPYSGSLFVFGGDSIYQVDPSHPKQVLSTLTVPGTLFDSGTTDGHGHLFVASNYGQMVIVDYHRTGRIGDLRDSVTQIPIRNDLVAVAPLIGPGSLVPPHNGWVPWAALGLGVLFAIAVGVVVVPIVGPRLAERLTPASRLPTWDLRRREAERINRNRQREAERKRRTGVGRNR